MSLKVFINGFTGRMGKSMLEQITENSNFEFIGGAGSRSLFDKDLNESSINDKDFNELVSKSDVIIDFSNDKGNEALLEKSKKT